MEPEDEVLQTHHDPCDEGHDEHGGGPGVVGDGEEEYHEGRGGEEEAEGWETAREAEKEVCAVDV